MEPLRLAFLGATEGLPYLRACRRREDVAVIGVCDRDTEQLGEVAQQFQLPFATTDDDKLLALPGLDAVVISTTDRNHRKHIVAALSAGLHVYCVPPLTQTSSDCGSLLQQVARSPAQRVMVGETRRFHPFLEAVKELLDDGELGTVYSAKVALYTTGAEYEKPHAWRADPKTGTHPAIAVGHAGIDLAAWLVGEPVEVVARATHARLPRLPFEDTIQATFTCRSGALIELLIAVAARRPAGLTLELLGTGGAVSGSLGGGRNLAWILSAGELQRRELPDGPSAGGPDRSLAEFFAAIREGRPPAVSLQTAARTIAAGMAIIQSLRSGERAAIEPLRTPPAG